MSDIDEVSSTLGKLTAITEHISRKIDEMSTKYDTHHDTLVRAKIAADSAHKRIDEKQGDIDAINERVAFLDSVYQRGVAVVGVVSLIVSGVVGILIKMF